MIPIIALTIAIAGVTIGAGVITLSKFQETTTYCYNSSFSPNDDCSCTNATGTNGTSFLASGEKNMTYTGYAICQSRDGEATIAEQLPTVAIIGIMVIIISIIAGVFVYMRYFA